MKGLTMFVMETCPFCQGALRLMDALKAEYPAYAAIPIRIVDEALEADYAEQFDYYYVPSYYMGGVKLHEGAAKKDDIRRVFDAAMAN